MVKCTAVANDDKKICRDGENACLAGDKKTLCNPVSAAECKCEKKKAVVCEEIALSHERTAVTDKPLCNKKTDKDGTSCVYTAKASGTEAEATCKALDSCANISVAQLAAYEQTCEKLFVKNQECQGKSNNPSNEDQCENKPAL